jgi:hypothetical protein
MQLLFVNMHCIRTLTARGFFDWLDEILTDDCTFCMVFVGVMIFVELPEDRASDGSLFRRSDLSAFVAGAFEKRASFLYSFSR